MKKKIYILAFASLAFFLLTGISGYSVNPVDPPKPISNAAAVTFSAPSPTDECSDLMSLVDVTVYVTFTECPDYDCCYPRNCSFNYCIYDYLGNELDCKAWTPDDCQLTFTGIRGEEGTKIRGKLILLTSCICEYNDDIAESTTIPTGGGSVDITTTYCP